MDFQDVSLRGLLVSGQDHDESEKRIEAARHAHKAKLQARRDARLKSSLAPSRQGSTPVLEERTAQHPSALTHISEPAKAPSLVNSDSSAATDKITAPDNTEKAQDISSTESTRIGASTRTTEQVSSSSDVGPKRVAPMSGFGDERRAKGPPTTAGTKVPRSLVGGSARFHPYAAPASQSAKTAKTAKTSESGSRPFSKWRNPGWFPTTRIEQAQINREVYDWLLQFREHVSAYEASLDQTPQLDRLSQIRILLHRIERMVVNSSMVMKSRLIHDNQKDGLPQIFDGNRDAYPFDIRADAEILAIKWARKDFDPDIMRGIDLSRKTPRIRDDYQSRFSASQFGDETFVNGQWWPNRVTLFRDGAHGAWEAGIHGKAGLGAYSIVVSHSTYDDKDSGDSLLYCGTQKKENSTEDTASTQLLIDSHEKMPRNKEGVRKRRPVRVFRTYTMDPNSPFRPERGIRYDGLYEVVAVEQLRPEMKRFSLQRIAGQDPIRNEGPAKRPTDEEINEFDRYLQTRRNE